MNANTLNTFLIIIILVLVAYHFCIIERIKRTSFEEGYVTALEKSSYQLLDEYDRGYSNGKKEKEIQMREELELTEKLLKERHHHELQNEQLKHKNQMFIKEEQYRKNMENFNNDWQKKITDSISVIVENYNREVSILRQSIVKEKVYQDEYLNDSSFSKNSQKDNQKTQLSQSIKRIFTGLIVFVFFSLLIQGLLSKHGRLKWR